MQHRGSIQSFLHIHCVKVAANESRSVAAVVSEWNSVSFVKRSNQHLDSNWTLEHKVIVAEMCFSFDPL